MRAIVAAIEARRLAAKACLVASNRAGAPALEFARVHEIKALCIPTIADPATADNRLSEALVERQIDLVILSGYLRKVGPATLGAFDGRILNIHPSLLPDFGGPGMYGRRVHEAVVASGVKVSGASVHRVDSEYDHGEVIARLEIPLAPGETAESLEAKVTAAEPALFVSTLTAIAEGRLQLSGAEQVGTPP